MARLATIGAETGDLLELGTSLPANLTNVTSPVNSGNRAYRSNPSSASGGFRVWESTVPNGTGLYFKTYFRIASWPGAGAIPFVPIMQPINTSGSTMGYVRVESDGKLALRTSPGAVEIGSLPAGTIALDTWYCIEMFQKVAASPTTSNGSLEARLNKVSFASTTSTNIGTAQFSRLAAASFSTDSYDCFWDDIAINDDSGSEQNSWPGYGKIVLLKPTSDNAVGTGWTQPATTGDDTTNIYESVNNVPAIGVAHSDVDANNLKYIFNDDSTDTANYDANAESYEDVGIQEEDEITVAQAVAIAGSSSTTDTNGAIKLVSNPADSGEASFVYDVGVTASTHPTGWGIKRGNIVYAPSVTIDDPSVVRVGKRTLTGRTAMVDLLGVMVEYVPAILGEANLSAQTNLASVGFGKFSGATAISSQSNQVSLGRYLATAASSLNAGSNLIALGGEYVLGASVFSSIGNLSATGAEEVLASASFSAEGLLTDLGIGLFLGAAQLSAENNLQVSATASFALKSNLSSMSALSADGGATRLGNIVFSGKTHFTAPPEPQPPLWHRVNLDDDWSFVRGAARLLLSPMEQEFPEEISDIIDLNTFDPVGEWEDAGATKGGINFGLEGAEETIAINQITGLIEPDPHNWKYGFSTQLAENTLEHLQTSWELGNITVVGGNERKAGYGSTTKLTKRRIAVIFKNPRTGLIRAFAFRKATIAPQDRISVFNKTGEQNVIPVQFTLYPDFNIRDIRQRFFTVFEQVN